MSDERKSLIYACQQSLKDSGGALRRNLASKLIEELDKLVRELSVKENEIKYLNDHVLKIEKQLGETRLTVLRKVKEVLEIE